VTKRIISTWNVLLLRQQQVPNWSYCDTATPMTLQSVYPSAITSRVVLHVDPSSTWSLATSRHHPYATNITCTMAGDAWSVVLRAQWGRPQLAWHFVNNSSQQQLPYSTNNILDKSTVAYVNFYQKLYEKTPSLCLSHCYIHPKLTPTHTTNQKPSVKSTHACVVRT